MEYEKVIIGVAGCGFVGSAVARGFNLFADIRTYDTNPLKCSNSFEEVLESDFVFVCLPTPMVSAEGGECNLSIIEGFFDSVYVAYLEGKIKKMPIFVLKSTVPVGTTASIRSKYKSEIYADAGGVMDLHIVHSPEFLTARSALLDFVTPARNIVGGDGDIVEKTANLYRERFPGVPCYTMTSDESEMVKYMANCFFATKVLFFNEMKLLADAKGLNWDRLLAGVLSDGRIAKSHYQVPGHDGDNGFGGTCFPKDINALISTFEKYNLNPLVLKAVWDQNKKVRKNWDWAKSSSAVMEKKNDM